MKEEAQASRASMSVIAVLVGGGRMGRADVVYQSSRVCVCRGRRTGRQSVQMDSLCPVCSSSRGR